eukprot:CAMPEP_0197532366 /NCGR_PEP_ID=MMETSP1318-20131121/39417_1 /TAXON_ID=552666 /ORGANISM="Partenskyella glossopodia, Strain RCC365" /LENGTH=180 /DNA_ID=CAMNT_0043088905 /DNA_START=27 /DNA_END=569 /DNA_ORIENTATION=+
MADDTTNKLQINLNPEPKQGKSEAKQQQQQKKQQKSSNRPAAFRAPRPKRTEPGKRRSTLEQLLHNVSERKGEGKRSINQEELEKHDTPEDAWCSIAGHVFDLTKMIKGEKRHPGGVKILEKYAGKEATTQFQMFHYPRGTAVKWASSDEFYIGPLEKEKGSASSGGFLSALNPLGMLFK